MSEPARLSRVEMYRDTDSQWRFRAIALNGEIVAVGESYVNRDDCAAEARRLWPDTPLEEHDDKRATGIRQ